jgi:phosphocarrier protein
LIVTIANRLGLHARAAAQVVRIASAYESDIRIVRGDKEVDGKSIMGLMMLAASQGTEIEIRAEGVDAEDALEALRELIATRFGESA